MHAQRGLQRRLTEAEVLGITTGASKIEIKKAYHKVRKPPPQHICMLPI